MHLFRYVWLLAVLVPNLTVVAQNANLGIWDIDTSCSNYHDARTRDTTGLTDGSNEVPFVQTMFNRVLAMVLAARRDLNVCLGPRPNSRRHRRAYENWERIADNMWVTLGFSPDPDRTERWTDPYWRDAFDLYDKMARVLRGTQNDPPRGYVRALSRLPGARPLFVCGENFDWIGLRDVWPGGNVELQDLPEMRPKIRDEGMVGVWYKKHRWFAQTQVRHKPIFCSPGDRANTLLPWDMIVMCDVTFLFEKYNWVSRRDVAEGHWIGDLMQAAEPSLFHELTHWFGGLHGNNVYYPRIEDVTAVDDRGRLLYKDADNNGYRLNSASDPQIAEEGLTPIGAYSVNSIFNLAKRHTTPAVRANSGPAKALINANSLTMFAMMSYHNDWFWRQGRATSAEDVFD